MTAKKIITRAIFFIVFLLLFLVFKTQHVAAAAPTFSVSPNGAQLDETVNSVQVTFSGLSANTDYYLCYDTDNCEGDDTNNDGKTTPIKSDGNSQITFTACGDGDKKIKINGGNKNLHNCEDGHDYFHGGKVYTPTLADFNTNFKVPALFKVNYYYPEPENIHITPEHPKPGDTLTVTIAQNKLRAGSRDDKNRNRYKLLLERKDGSYNTDVGCKAINTPNTPITLTIPDNGDALQPATYTLTIHGCDDEDISFYTSEILVDDQNGTVAPIVKNGGANNAPIEGYTDEPTPPNFNKPCVKGYDKNGNLTSNSDDIKHCTVIPTALGGINVDAPGLIKSVFSIILGLSGGIALLLIIYSGYQMITSQGNPEKLEAARQQLVSAIVGLLFIIFSLVILQFIGVDILQLDKIIGGGFGK